MYRNLLRIGKTKLPGSSSTLLRRLGALQFELAGLTLFVDAWLSSNSNWKRGNIQKRCWTSNLWWGWSQAQDWTVPTEKVNVWKAFLTNCCWMNNRSLTPPYSRLCKGGVHCGRLHGEKWCMVKQLALHSMYVLDVVPCDIYFCEKKIQNLMRLIETFEVVASPS